MKQQITTLDKTKQQEWEIKLKQEMTGSVVEIIYQTKLSHSLKLWDPLPVTAKNCFRYRHNLPWNIFFPSIRINQSVNSYSTIKIDPKAPPNVRHRWLTLFFGMLLKWRMSVRSSSLFQCHPLFLCQLAPAGQLHVPLPVVSWHGLRNHAQMMALVCFWQNSAAVHSR